MYYSVFGGNTDQTVLDVTKPFQMFVRFVFIRHSGVMTFLQQENVFSSVCFYNTTLVLIEFELICQLAVINTEKERSKLENIYSKLLILCYFQVHEQYDTLLSKH